MHEGNRCDLAANGPSRIGLDDNLTVQLQLE